MNTKQWLEYYTEHPADFEAMVKLAEDTIKQQAEQIATLEYIVETYAAHNPNCDKVNWTPNDEQDTTAPVCTCGYDNAVKGYFKQYAVKNDDYDYSTQKNFD